MGNYVQDTVDALVAKVGEDDGSDGELMRLYALLVHVRGTATSLEDVHDAWALARSVSRPGHPDLVPFDELGPEIQAYDRPFRDAIRAVAAERAR